MDTAIEKGAMALFGENCSESVRVRRWVNLALNCAAYYVQRTGDIDSKITSEGELAPVFAGLKR